VPVWMRWWTDESNSFFVSCGVLYTVFTVQCIAHLACEHFIIKTPEVQ